MGFIYVDVVVRGLESVETIRMLVDTGSTYIILDPKIIKRLKLLSTPYTVELTLADKRRVKARLFRAEVEVQGRKGPAFIAEVDTPTPLLGVYALETLGFKVDPTTGRLESIAPEGGYLLYCLDSEPLQLSLK